MNISKVDDIIGNTPLLDLSDLVPNPNAKLFAKVEFLQPGFSIKDRIVNRILTKAAAAGELERGSTVVCASSGNTGAATAMLAASRGYKAVIFTSAKCSDEKQATIRAYGAELTVVVGNYMQAASDYATEHKCFDVNQYENLDNRGAYELTLGPEIWNQTNHGVTHFVAAGSTGGTISGVGKYLKDQSKHEVQIVLADPVGSIFREAWRHRESRSFGKLVSTPFLVEGVGKGSVPGNMDLGVIDRVVAVTDTDSFSTCHELARSHGWLVGGSSGCNLWAALKVANDVADGQTATVVTVFPDSGLKYLSKIYNPAWLKAHAINIEPKEQIVKPH
jgi:cysteine synthase